MARQVINTGSYDNDPSADSADTVLRKTDTNFAELYTAFGLSGRQVIHLDGSDKVRDGFIKTNANAEQCYTARGLTGRPVVIVGAFYDDIAGEWGREACIKVNTITQALYNSVTPSIVTYYVAITGNDNNPGTLEQPFRTITKGISVLQVGQRVVVRGGTYVAFDYTGVSGSSWANAPRVEAYPGESVTITHYLHVWGTPTKHYVIFDGLDINGTGSPRDECVRIANGSTHMRFINCVIRHANRQGVLAPRQVDGNLEFINCKVHTNGTTTSFDHGLYLSSSDNIIDGCEIYNNKAWGVHIYNGHAGETANRTIIRNNRVYGNGVGGSNGGGVISGSGTGGRIYNNLIYSNLDGVLVASGATPTDQRILNNTIYNNGRNGVQIQSGTGHIVRNNIIRLNQTNTSFLVSVTNSNNLTTDPLFVNAAAGDFKVQNGSPAIDTGMTLSEVPIAYDGVSRPQGAAYDIGAYERAV